MKASLAALLILATVFFSCTSQRNTGGPLTKGDPSELRVLCYNIHHANPPTKAGLIDIDAIAAVIKDQQPDLVALQEVDMNTIRSGKNLNQAETLARLTGMNFYFARSIDYEGGQYGIALLSRYPMTNARKYALPTAEGTNGEPRSLATAVINLPNNKQLLFAGTHLDAQRNDTNRVLQINAIAEILKNETLPVIIAGDFNAEPNSRVMQISDQYFQRTCTGDNCGFTIPVINPRKTIDFIAFTPGKFDVLNHKVIDTATYASDHLPVFSVLKLK